MELEERQAGPLCWFYRPRVQDRRRAHHLAVKLAVVLFQVPDHVLGLSQRNAAADVVLIAPPTEDPAHVGFPGFWLEVLPARRMFVVYDEPTRRRHLGADRADAPLAFQQRTPLLHAETVLS